MKLKTQIKALAPVLNELACHRIKMPVSDEMNEARRIEFNVRRVAALMLGVDMTYLGMGIDDLLFAESHGDEFATPEAQAAYVLDRTAFWTNH